PRKGATRSAMSFRQAQQAVDQWVAQFEQGYFTPLANVARLAEEVGELAREVNHRFGPKPKKLEEAPGSIAMELADILFVVICIANSKRMSASSMAIEPGAASSFFAFTPKQCS